MTNREFYSVIINSTLSTEIKDFASEALNKLDARNDKRRNTLTKDQIANKSIKKDIVALLVKPMVASAIATELGISTQKVSALCKQLVDENLVKVADVKIKGKGSVKEYSLVVAD